MRVKGIVSEDFLNYRHCGMFINTISCNGKCYIDLGLSPSTCHNMCLMDAPTIDIPTDEILDMYMKNDMTKAVIFGGLEPLLQVDEIYEFIYKLRIERQCDDDIVIYTGYNIEEGEAFLYRITDEFRDIVVKYGRYIPNSEKKFDPVLGVTLASCNQHAVAYR